MLVQLNFNNEITYITVRDKLVYYAFTIKIQYKCD